MAPPNKSALFWRVLDWICKKIANGVRTSRYVLYYRLNWRPTVSWPPSFFCVMLFDMSMRPAQAPQTVFRCDWVDIQHFNRWKKPLSDKNMFKVVDSPPNQEGDNLSQVIPPIKVQQCHIPGMINASMSSWTSCSDRISITSNWTLWCGGESMNLSLWALFSNYLIHQHHITRLYRWGGGYT